MIKLVNHWKYKTDSFHTISLLPTMIFEVEKNPIDLSKRFLFGLGVLGIILLISNKPSRFK